MYLPCTYHVLTMYLHQVRLVPNTLSDPNDFGSLADLHGISRKEGYQGGLVLLQA